jgi:hypothetical protein
MRQDIAKLAATIESAASPSPLDPVVMNNVSDMQRMERDAAGDLNADVVISMLRAERPHCVGASIVMVALPVVVRLFKATSYMAALDVLKAAEGECARWTNATPAMAASVKVRVLNIEFAILRCIGKEKAATETLHRCIRLIQITKLSKSDRISLVRRVRVVFETSQSPTEFFAECVAALMADTDGLSGSKDVLRLNRVLRLLDGVFDKSQT